MRAWPYIVCVGLYPLTCSEKNRRCLNRALCLNRLLIEHDISVNASGSKRATRIHRPVLLPSSRCHNPTATIDKCYTIQYIRTLKIGFFECSADRRTRHVCGTTNAIATRRWTVERSVFLIRFNIGSLRKNLTKRLS